jgi:hypothetical protein
MPFALNSPFQPVQATGYSNGFATQQTGYVANSPFQPQSNSPFAQQPQQLQPNFTGAGFGGYTPQPSFQPSALAPIPQNTIATFQTGAAPGMQTLQTGQSTNPFRTSMLMNQQTAAGLASPASPTIPRQSTNPFARSSPAATPFSPASNSPFQQQPSPPAPLQPTPTGTNPFARNFTSSPPQQAQGQQAPAALAPQPTGSTNPFRQGAFVNHATGVGWQHTQTPIGGGLDHVETIPVFPRPAQQTPWQQ